MYKKQFTGSSGYGIKVGHAPKVSPDIAKGQGCAAVGGLLSGGSLHHAVDDRKLRRTDKRARKRKKPSDGRDESQADDLRREQGTVSFRVVLELRFAEVKPICSMDSYPSNIFQYALANIRTTGGNCITGIQ